MANFDPPQKIDTQSTIAIKYVIGNYGGDPCSLPSLVKISPLGASK